MSQPNNSRNLPLNRILVQNSQRYSLPGEAPQNNTLGTKFSNTGKAVVRGIDTAIDYGAAAISALFDIPSTLKTNRDFIAESKNSEFRHQFFKNVLRWYFIFAVMYAIYLDGKMAVNMFRNGANAKAIATQVQER